MRPILADISSLGQYLQLFYQESLDFPKTCPHCGYKGLWHHGHFFRKADRCKSHDLIPIQRFYCRSCERTCSVLPECIPPRRWYLWEIQQTVLLLFLIGKTCYAISKAVVPSFHTIREWLARFEDQFLLHKDALCNLFIGLGCTTHFVNFWHACLQKLSLGSAMRLCHVSGVEIP